MPPTRLWEAARRAFWGPWQPASDLVEEMSGSCGAERARRAGHRHRRRAPGSYAYYEQVDHRYLELESATHHEIVGFVGNVSLRDDRPFLHAHATFADATGATVGGHLLRGCEVFAAEVMIRELGDVSLVRAHDEQTGLALW